MANLGNLYSSLKTRVSNFLNDDEENKIQATNPVRSANFNLTQNYTPVRTKPPTTIKIATPTQAPGQNPVSSWFSNNFSTGYKNFQDQQALQQQEQNKNKLNFTKDILSRKTTATPPAPKVALKTSNIEPPSFFTKVNQAVKDFGTGIQVSAENPLDGANIKNVLPNIGKNILDPKTGKSEFAISTVRAPWEQLKGALPQFFDIPITNIKGETKSLGDILIPTNTPDENLRAQVSDTVGKVDREILIYKYLGDLGLNKILPTFRVGGNLLAKEGISSAMDYVFSHPQFTQNIGKYLVGQFGLNLTNTILDEKYKGEDPKQVGGQLLFDTLLSSLTFAGIESTVGAYGATKFLDDVAFIKNSRSAVNRGISEEIANELGQLQQQKLGASFNPNQPVNNPEFVAWQNSVKEAYKEAARTNNFGSLMKYMRDVPVAPQSYIPELGSGLPSQAAVIQSIQTSPVTEMTAKYIANSQAAPAIESMTGNLPQNPAQPGGNLWDANRAFNQKNTQKITDDTLSGLREKYRMDIPRNIENWSNVIGVENATPETMINVYRAGTGNIESGNFVTTIPEIAQKYQVERPGSEILQQEVPLKDLVQSGGVRGEFVYAPETPEIATQKSMAEFTNGQNQIATTQQVEQIRGLEQAINNNIPSDYTANGQVELPADVMDNLNKLRLALDEDPKFITELDGKTIRNLEDAGIEVQGVDGEYKSAIEALQEFRASQAESPAIQDVNGVAQEQALTDTQGQVLDQAPVETSPVASLGNQQIEAGVGGTTNAELAQVTGQPQNTDITQDIGKGATDQTTTGEPAYVLPGHTASYNKVTSRTFPEGQEKRTYPKPILVDPDGNAFILGKNPKTTHFIDKVINRILNLGKPEDSKAIIEGVNNLLPSGEKIALPTHTGPLTVATRQQAVEALSRLQPGQRIEVFNQLKNNKKVLQLISDEQIQAIQAETADLLSGPFIGDLNNFVANSVDSSAFKSTKTGGIANTPQQFKDWVNNRSASDIAGVRARQAFDAMDNDKIEAFHKIQQGEKSTFAKQLREYFDSRYEKLKDAGFELGYREDYIPQLWENTDEEVTKALGDRLSKRPGLTFERFIDDYQEGIEKGLTPRFEKLSDLVGWYESTTNKAIADKKFFDFLDSNELIKPSSKAPRGWITVDPDRFPTPPGQPDGNYKAPAEVAKVVNNYLGQGNEVLRELAGVTSRMKNVVLSGGIPGTGINAHGFNLLVRYTLANKNPIVGAAKGAYYLTNPNAAKANLDKSLEKMEFFIRHGMTASTEEHAFTRSMKEVEDNILKQGLGKMSDLQQTLFEDPLFTKAVPWMKTELADQIYQEAKSKMGEEEAARTAARTVNTLMGGINVDELARSKDFQNLLRVTILAPDWAETNARVAADAVKGSTTGIKDPQYKTYRRLMAAFLGSYAAMNMLNKGLSGHWTWENEPGNEFNLDTGTYSANGKKRYVRVYGTAVDAIRIPFEIISGALKGDLTPTFRTIKNRLSTPLGTGVALLSNTDYTGQKIINKEDPIGQQIASVAGVVSRMFLPSQVGAAFDYLGGKSPEEVLTRALELPVRYQGGAYSNTQKEVTQMMQDGGATNETIGEINAAIKGESLSDAQKQNVARLANENPEEAKQYIETIKARRSVDDAPKPKTPLEFIQSLFSGKKEDVQPGEFIPSEDKAIRKEQISEIKSRLEAGMPVSEKELDFAYFGDMLDIPTGNSTEKLKAEEDLYGKISSIMKDENLTDQQKNQLLGTVSTALDVPRSDIEYYANASESVQVRFDMISQEVQKMNDPEDAFNFLVQLKKEVNGKAMISSTIITDLYETGLISNDMKKLLGKYRWNPITKKVELSRSSSEGSTKKPSKLSLDIPNVKTPSLDLPAINISFKNSNLVPLTTQGGIQPPDSLRPNLISTRTGSSSSGANLSPRVSPMVTTLNGLGRI